MRETADPWQDVAATVEALALRVAPDFHGRMRTYLTELARWSRVARLTGYRGEAAQVRHLVIESLMLLGVLPEAAGPLLDIGTGPGVPGVILKCARPDWEVVLVEANRRRANFVRHVVRALALRGVTVCQERAESLAREGDLHGRFRTVTMRAVVGPDQAARLAAPFLPEGEALVLPLGPTEHAVLGTVREVAVGMPRAGLSLRRQFLIITATELARVPRGT